MPFTIEDALELEVFSRVSFEVYAGHENLRRPIRWVHPVELHDIARFLAGGEMLLTAGLGIGHSAEAQRAYVRSVSEADAAILVLELSGREYSRMPDALIDEANRVGLPLVGLDGELPFVEVSAQVHEQLVNERFQELTTYERINSQVIEVLAVGGDYLALCHVLAQEIKHPVVLEDPAHHILAHASETSESIAEVDNWSQHPLTHADDVGTQSRPRPTLTLDDAARSVGCTRKPVTIRGETWGWLHVLHESSELGRVDVHACERTADAIAISVMSAREAGARVAQRESALVSRLLLGDISGDAFIRRALRFGTDLRSLRLVAVWASTASSDDQTHRRLAHATESLGLPRVLADIDEHAMAVVGLPTDASLERLVEWLEDHGPATGISRACEPPQLEAAIRQARQAAAAAVALPASRAVQFDDLGMVRLLVSLSDGPELADYVNDELGAILAHDAASTNPLLPTLQAYIDNGGNKSRTATALYIQRRTLYYRLQRIDRLIRGSLDDADVRRDLSFALHGLTLLNRSATAPLRRANRNKD